MDKSVEAIRLGDDSSGHHSGNGGQTGSADGRQATSDIGAEQARTIAAAHAGLSVSDVTFSKTELDYDDGYMVYEVEFYSGKMEYECKIDACSGVVLEYESDLED